MNKSLNSLFAQEASNIDCSERYSVDSIKQGLPNLSKSRSSTENLIESLRAEIEILNSKLSEAQERNREILEEKEILEGLNKEMESQLSSYRNQAFSFKRRLTSYKEKAGTLSRKNSEMQIELYELNIERDRIRQKSNTKKLSINKYAEKLNRYKYKTRTLKEQVKQKTVELDSIKTENFKDSYRGFDSLREFKARSHSRFQPPREEVKTAISKPAERTLKTSLQFILTLKHRTEDLYKQLMEVLPTNSSKVQELELHINKLIEQLHDTKESLENLKPQRSPKKRPINRICRLFWCSFDARS